ncbi:DNA-deoxyinosine glycosylase [Hydrocarboniphaga effusa]|uniref:DNA-deoxyinosine glycosylase n=1 Tax=Hydrocarboniphaga effusa TaxID=243629 RepID=UPI0035ADA006
MTLIYSFPAVVDERAHTLVLGSMPGALSLQANQYYAHPQNAFWRIMGDLFGAHRELAYADRLRLLQHHGLALWDVLKCCIRQGSLDSSIVEDSIEPNDLATLLRDHPRIERVFFNGSKAEQSFKRYVRLPALASPPRFARLPSTSPAHATLNYAAKLEAWRLLLSPPAARKGPCEASPS